MTKHNVVMLPLIKKTIGLQHSILPMASLKYVNLTTVFFILSVDFCSPLGVCLDQSGAIFVAEWSENKVVKYC